ncbi:hypothetical protein ACLI1C_12015 [Devosia sp. XGJD_8]|uniref:hypothetical protein n=1 Tax=Devosia sp. XGJD_8 TaxID=3391187 RepID=UPI0039846687
MKTHDLGRALTQLGKVLRSLPNQDVDSLGAETFSSQKPDANIGISLSALAALSKFSKTDWEKVVKDFALPIELRQRDAARDIMGKILTYLADNEAERQRIAMSSRSTSDRPSELTSALEFLLKNG